MNPKNTSRRNCLKLAAASGAGLGLIDSVAKANEQQSGPASAPAQTAPSGEPTIPQVPRK